jgi:hypothetical protein
MRRAKKKGRAPQTPPRPSPAGEGEANLLSGLSLLAGEVVDVWEMFLVDNVLYIIEEMA